uniref:ferroxidase n=1 Tax=Dicentrarchus labrax TaxID=13489 RepID=A0A8C4NLE0_DICLA
LWKIDSQLRRPMACLLFFLSSSAEGKGGRERVYYVGIIEDSWNYAPSGKNLLNGEDTAEDEFASVFLEKGTHRIGSVYKKAMFRQYTDASYSHLAPRPAWLGFLGPILRAEVDDVIVVHLKNFASRNYSMHPHGVFYEKNAEGALYPDGTSNMLKMDDCVPPGGSYTYRWEVRPEFAPTDDDANCLTWVYHSHLDAPKDIATGLIGALLTCKKGLKKYDQSVRNDVDQDVFLMFNVVDENLSWYLEDNIQSCFDPAGVIQTDPDFEESNLMHAINGYMFGNLPGIELCQNRLVAWHLFGMGNEVDIHSAFFHGNTLLDRGHRTDVLSLFPATFATAEMVPKSTGKWLLSCQVNDHLQAGMQAFYEVNICGSKDSSTEMAGIVRNYYLAAEEVLWNYAPSGKDLINNVSLTEADRASEIFFGQDGGRIGGQYKKVIYKEYTDNTFTTTKPTTPESQHLGLLGPVLRAEEGDTLRVTFMNKANRNYSIHPHGLHYDKHYQGSRYEDGEEVAGYHYSAGMRQQYRVNLCQHHKMKHTHTEPTKIVQYFISAEEIEWDYSPERDWELEKHHPISEERPGNMFVEKGENRIGSRYKKVVYREYTDDTFKVQKKRQPNEQHLGIIGPLIKAEVGEQIVITFKNKATAQPYSITAHGVKASGAHIPVQPGRIIELTWDVPESSGPGVSDPNCITYAYYSSVHFIKDLYSGLLGPLVICRPGTLGPLQPGEGPHRQRRDVENEFALLFMVHDENHSWYLNDNIRKYLGVDPENFKPDEDFEESNKMHGINGKLYGNLHGLVMTQGQKVDWYLLGMGNEVDMHTVHFHAETFTYKTDRVHRADVFDLFPGTFQTVEMVAGNPGTWLLHCHVTDHIHAGMETTFTIKEVSKGVYACICVYIFSTFMGMNIHRREFVITSALVLVI